MPKNYAVILVGAIVVAAGAYGLGRFMIPGPPPIPPTDDSHDVRPPPPAPEPIVAPVNQTIVLPPLPQRDAPALVPNKNRVRQTLKPGKTYKTMLRGAIKTRGTDTNWGIETVVFIHYMFEAQIDREIIENDGEVVVEHRHFVDIRSVKIDTNLEDIRLKLDSIRFSGPILMFVGAMWPQTALTIKSMDGLSAAPLLKVLTAFGADPAQLTGVKGKVLKVFTQFDGLTGKTVKMVYWNKTKEARPGEGAAGVIELVQLKGNPMTESEKFFHQHSAVLSDVLIFPEKKEVGQEWKVAGNNFSNLIDPGLRAAVRGELGFSRRANRKLDGKEVYVLVAEGGRLELVSFEFGEGRVGWFEPRGEMLYSPDDQVVIKAEMSGKGSLERLSRFHLLFRTEMRQSPEMDVGYTCTVIDTPGREKK